MKEFEIENHLSNWLANHFSDSDLLIEKEAKVQLGSNFQQMLYTDLIAIQSKSNVLHTFEIKNKINPNLISSVIWQVDSMYGNYKWLVLNEDCKQFLPIESFKKKGLGLILFKEKNTNKIDFEISLSAKYVDGNLLKYYPTVNEKWIKKVKNGCHTRSEKKN